MNAVHAECILCRQSRCGRHGIAAMGGNDLLVSLEASVAINRQSFHVARNNNGAHHCRKTASSPIANAASKTNYKKMTMTTPKTGGKGRELVES